MKSSTKVSAATKLLMICISILLIAISIIGASGISNALMDNNALSNANNLSEVSSTSSIDPIAQECREYTKSTLSERTSDLNNVFDYIPKSVFTRPEGGWYYYVGEKYGFALTSTPINDSYYQ